MRKKLGTKPFVYHGSVVIIATYDENETSNAVHAARGAGRT